MHTMPDLTPADPIPDSYLEEENRDSLFQQMCASLSEVEPGPVECARATLEQALRTHFAGSGDVSWTVLQANAEVRPDLKLCFTFSVALNIAGLAATRTSRHEYPFVSRENETYRDAFQRYADVACAQFLQPVPLQVPSLRSSDPGWSGFEQLDEDRLRTARQRFRALTSGFRSEIPDLQKQFTEAINGSMAERSSGMIGWDDPCHAVGKVEKLTLAVKSSDSGLLSVRLSLTARYLHRLSLGLTFQENLADPLLRLDQEDARSVLHGSFRFLLEQLKRRSMLLLPALEVGFAPTSSLAPVQHFLTTGNLWLPEEAPPSLIRRSCEPGSRLFFHHNDQFELLTGEELSNRNPETFAIRLSGVPSLALSCYRAFPPNPAEQLEVFRAMDQFYRNVAWPLEKRPTVFLELQGTQLVSFSWDTHPPTQAQILSRPLPIILRLVLRAVRRQQLQAPAPLDLPELLNTFHPMELEILRYMDSIPFEPTRGTLQAHLDAFMPTTASANSKALRAMFQTTYPLANGTRALVEPSVDAGFYVLNPLVHDALPKVTGRPFNSDEIVALFTSTARFRWVQQTTVKTARANCPPELRETLLQVLEKSDRRLSMPHLFQQSAFLRFLDSLDETEVLRLWNALKKRNSTRALLLRVWPDLRDES